MSDRELADEEHEAWWALQPERRAGKYDGDITRFWKERDPKRSPHAVRQRHTIWGKRVAADATSELLWDKMEREGMTLQTAAGIAIDHRKQGGTIEDAIARRNAGKFPRTLSNGKVVYAGNRKGRDRIDRALDSLLAKGVGSQPPTQPAIELAPETPRTPTEPAPPPSDPKPAPPSSVPPASAVPESVIDDSIGEEPNGGAWWSVRVLIENLARRATWGMDPKDVEPLMQNFIIDAKELVRAFRRKLHQRGDIATPLREIKASCQLLNIPLPKKSGTPLDIRAARKNAKLLMRDHHVDRTGKEAYDEEMFLSIGVALEHVEKYNQMLGETT